ncbi:hypothetical protein R6Q57_018412 [Mikania cordata]
MGNCTTCLRPYAPESTHYQPPPTPQAKKKHNKQKPNPYAESPVPIRVLNDFAQLATHRTRISDKYTLGRELGRGEFGVTYLCTDRETKHAFACKSISKKKLRTAVDVEDVRRKVTIMSTLPEHPNIVKLRATYEDHEAVHLVMELCEGGELLTGSLLEGITDNVRRTESQRRWRRLVRMCHENGSLIAFLCTWWCRWKGKWWCRWKP